MSDVVEVDQLSEVITKARLEQMLQGREVRLSLGTILTRAARDWAREQGISLIFEENGTSPEIPGDPGEKGVNRAILTVLGYDRVGIIAAVSGILAKFNVNIMDISQTVLQGFFAMIMIVDLSGCRVDLAELRNTLEQKGEEMGLKVTLQHEDIFRYMHRI